MIAFDTLPKAFPADKTAVALGIFDGLHLGHMAVLTALMDGAARKNLTPCVFTFNTRNARPAAKTGTHLLNSAKRDVLLQKIGIEYVVRPDFMEFRDKSPKEFAEFLSGYLNAKAVFCGESFRFGKGASAAADNLRQLLFNIADVHIIKTVVEDGGPVSATRIKSLLENGSIASANRLLGRAFCVDAPVVHGRGLGRKLKLPTINQQYPANLAAPRFGVYASETLIDGAKYASVTNIGLKPTVGGAPLSAETHILGCSGDLYGKDASVALIEFIRGEEKFKDVDQMKEQIQKDIIVSQEIYKSLK